MKYTAEEICLAKAILAASQALDIDMGDGEATYQCCNSVCGHCKCLIGNALELAKTITTLTEEDLRDMNHARRLGGIEPLLPTNHKS